MNTIIWAENQSFTSTQDGDMVHKIIAGNLVVKSGITVTVANRCKGLHIQVMGNCYLYGTITMTARGCYAVGQNVGIEAYADRNTITLDGANYSTLPTCRKIPATGGGGGARVGGKATKDVKYISGGAGGGAGSNGATGGGGSGAAIVTNMGNGCSAYSGAGAAGTSFCGGVGGGGAANLLGTDGTVVYGGAGAANGGAGGYGATNTAHAAHGGAGNPNGGDAPDSYCTPYHDMSGAGGLLIITVLGYLYIASGGIISSNGSSGGYGINSNDGLVYGAGGAGRFNSVGDANGGAGGAGSVRANSLRTT